jgi:hypothetical protein
MNLDELLDISGLLPDLSISEIPDLEVELPDLNIELPDLEIDLTLFYTKKTS